LRHVVVRPGAARDIHSFPTRRSSDLVVIGELPRLFRNCLGDFGPSVADVHAVKARKGIEAAPSVGVDDGTALAPGDDATGRLAARMHAHVGRGMEEVVAVPGVQVVVAVEHGVFLSRCQAAVSMQRYFSSVKASIPWRDPSRPRPDCFQPPKGTGPPVIFTRLTATMPKSSARDSRSARAPSRVTT